MAQTNGLEPLQIVLETIMLPLHQVLHIGGFSSPTSPKKSTVILECLERFELSHSVWKTDMLTIKHHKHIYTNITIKITVIFVLLRKEVILQKIPLVHFCTGLNDWI